MWQRTGCVSCRVRTFTRQLTQPVRPKSRHAAETRAKACGYKSNAMNDHLIILGASVRAAAFSALRAGLKPWCADLFADLDLRAKCPAVAIAASRYPNGLAALAREAPPGPWMYTGGLENRPRLIRRIASERPLWGNDAAALAKVRDPFAIQRALAEAGVPYLDVRRPRGMRSRGRGVQSQGQLVLDNERPGHPGSSLPPGDGRWLVKPIAGSGGAGVRFADDRPASPRDYRQVFREGESQSGVFVAAEEDTHLIGVTRQLVGENWLHAPAFRYCGSIGPLGVTEAERTAWLRLGRTVATFAGLRGVFGIDAIVNEGVPWPVDVNPRYTASVEVLEYAGQGATVGFWEPWLQPATVRGSEARRSLVVGKAVYYAARPLVMSDGPWSDVARLPLPFNELPPFADIPAVGQQVPAGTPVMTFFARASTPEGCAKELRSIAAEFDRRLIM
jgi:predicted ATP-grasp superfamily ATP-dependent carboligase